ncbi:hypothetical protein WISP_18300 [Willisornis vidua]|uniref:Uncharacterized protein n=1 Tax=Willisornis vidua TaxID=1566151 RepID=A0ABQ9DS94_9PASS|nr:hypothetical protein WISP_18300 [Willisornis vidua]
MLDPSSSEEESDELLEEERRDVLVAAGGGSPRSLPPQPPRDARGREAGAARAASPSPSPSVLSEGREEQERLQREEREKRLRLQLYVFIARCIAHPFNAKQPTDMARRQQKDYVVWSFATEGRKALERGKEISCQTYCSIRKQKAAIHLSPKLVKGPLRNLVVTVFFSG